MFVLFSIYMHTIEFDCEIDELIGLHLCSYDILILRGKCTFLQYLLFSSTHRMKKLQYKRKVKLHLHNRKFFVPVGLYRDGHMFPPDKKFAK